MTSIFGSKRHDREIEIQTNDYIVNVFEKKVVRGIKIDRHWFSVNNNQKKSKSKFGYFSWQFQVQCGSPCEIS